MTTETTTTDAPEESVLNRFKTIGEREEGAGVAESSELKVEAGENGAIEQLQKAAVEFRRLAQSGEIVAPTAPRRIGFAVEFRRSPEGLQQQEQQRQALVDQEAGESPFATIAAQQQRIAELEAAMNEIHDGIDDDNNNGYWTKQVAAKALGKEYQEYPVTGK